MPLLLIHGGTILTCDPESRFLPGGSVLVEGARIKAVLAAGEPLSPFLEDDDRIVQIDAHDCIVIPGLVNTHTHLLLGELRGLSDDLPLFPWLRELAPYIAKMDVDHFRWSSTLGVIESLRCGTTCLCECGRSDPLVTAEVASQAGLRIVAGGLPMSNLFSEPLPTTYDHLVENVREMMTRFGQGTELVTAMIGSHSPYNCSSDFIRTGKAWARELGVDFFIHLAECRDEIAYIGERFGQTPVQYLADLGVLDEHTVGIHSVWLTDDDIRLFQACGARVAHCPTSNAKLSSGVARVPEYRKAGIPVGLGTDSVVSNNRLSVFQEMSMAVLVQRLAGEDPQHLTAPDALRMATIEGARVLGLDREIGSIEPGKRADVVIVRETHPLTLTRQTAVSDIVYTVHRDEISKVIIDGRMVVDNGHLTQIDEDATRAEIQRFYRHVVAA